jgi:hypothetical protein
VGVSEVKQRTCSGVRSESAMIATSCTAANQQMIASKTACGFEADAATVHTYQQDRNTIRLRSVSDPSVRCVYATIVCAIHLHRDVKRRVCVVHHVSIADVVRSWIVVVSVLSRFRNSKVLPLADFSETNS